MKNNSITSSPLFVASSRPKKSQQVSKQHSHDTCHDHFCPTGQAAGVAGDCLHQHSAAAEIIEKTGAKADGQSHVHSHSHSHEAPSIIHQEHVHSPACVHALHQPKEIRPEYRLSRDTLPTHYHVTLEVDPKKAEFRGKVKSALLNTKPKSELTLHSYLLDLEKIHCHAQGKELVGKPVYDEESQRTKLVFEENIPVGPVSLEIEYSGKIRNDLTGMYRADDGHEQAIITQCQPASARSIFPCMDEPEFKATLQSTIIAPKGKTVISNGPLKKKTTTADGRQVLDFATTETPLPTYLFAMAIGDFETTEPELLKTGKKTIPSRIVAGPGKLPLTNFAADVTRNVVPRIADYFAMEYPSKKLDQVAAPGFDAGAMENTGAIFYRSSLLLTDEKTATQNELRKIATTIAHEVDHQWFGNLVSPEWWDSIWLNEAFASWHSVKMVSDWKPEMRMWDNFQSNYRSLAMNKDSMSNTIPIYSEVTDGRKALHNFNYVTYYKGSSVLRMVEQYVGEDRFRDGLRDYMRTHAGGNATGGDLWKALEKAAPGSDVAGVIQSWVEQPGFPVLKADLGKNDQGKTVLNLSQKRFRKSKAEDGAEEQSWKIPLVIRYQDDEGIKTHRVLFGEKDGSVELPAVGDVKWMYPNGGVSGFFRTELGSETLNRLHDSGMEHLSAGEKRNILDDQWAMATKGEAPLANFLQTLEAVSGEEDFHILSAVTSYLGSLESLVDESNKGRYQKLLAGFVLPHKERLDQLQESGQLSSDESPVLAALTKLAAKTLDDPATQKQLNEVVAREKAEPGSVDSSLAQIAIVDKARRGTHKEFQEFAKTYAARRANGSSPAIISRYLTSLAAFKDEKSGETVIKMLLGDKEGVPTYEGEPIGIAQDQLSAVMTSLLGNESVQQTAWQSLQDNWGQFKELAGTFGLERLVGALKAMPSEQLAEIEAFFQDKDVPQSVLDGLRENMALKESQKKLLSPQISAFLGQA